MSVEEKMSHVLNSVLQATNYSVKIFNDNRWDVYLNEEVILQTRSTRDINSHWRDVVKEEIAVIINERIKTALNEV